MTIKPLFNKVFLEPVIETVSSGGILIREERNPFKMFAMVTAVADGVTEVCVGDKVFFDCRYSTKVPSDSRLMAVDIKDIEAIVTEE